MYLCCEFRFPNCKKCGFGKCIYSKQIIEYNTEAAIYHLVLYLALDGITGFEACQVFGGIVVQGNADGEALLDLDEVAGGIVDGNEGERAACRIGETEDTAFVGDVRNRIHMNRDL